MNFNALPNKHLPKLIILSYYILAYSSYYYLSLEASSLALSAFYYLWIVQVTGNSIKLSANSIRFVGLRVGIVTLHLHDKYPVAPVLNTNGNKNCTSPN